MDKNNVVLQKGETIDFKWISAEDIVKGDYIPQRKAEYAVKIINDNGGIYGN